MPAGSRGRADDPELGHRRAALHVHERQPRRLGQVAALAAQLAVGAEQGVDQERQHRRVGGLELRPHARQVDRPPQPLVQHVRVADARRRVGVELEELHVVALEEGVEPADPKRPREAGVEADERVLGGRHGQLLAQAAVLGVGVAEAVEHGRQAGDRAPHPPQLARRDEVRHQHERDRAAARTPRRSRTASARSRSSIAAQRSPSLESSTRCCSFRLLTWSITPSVRGYPVGLPGRDAPGPLPRRSSSRSRWCSSSPTPAPCSSFGAAALARDPLRGRDGRGHRGDRRQDRSRASAAC